MERLDSGLREEAMGGGEELAAGTRLGEYEIERVIGCGGMGTVYAAWHPVLRSRAAIKVLNLDISHQAAMVERFVSEAQAASRVSHPNIIKVFGFGETADGRKYFVMEYLEGESMTAWLAKGRPDPEEALQLLLEVCEALEAAHREGITHRDLKPDNLWIARPKHGRPYTKILDFGIAKAVEGPVGRSNTKTGSLLGTPQFMSPEQCTGRGVDHRTDIYAMGGILYWVYCGRPPFERESPAELIAAHLYDTVPMPSVFSEVPPKLEALILACLEKNPEKRPGTAAELAKRLKAAASAEAMASAKLDIQEAIPRPMPARIVEPTAMDLVEPPPPSTANTGYDLEPIVVPRTRWPIILGVIVVLGGIALWLGSRGRQAPVASKPSEPPPASNASTATPAGAEHPNPAVNKASPTPPTPVPATSPSHRPRQPSAVSRIPKSAGAKSPSEAKDPKPTKAASPPGPSPTDRQWLIEENPFQ